MAGAVRFVVEIIKSHCRSFDSNVGSKYGGDIK